MTKIEKFLRVNGIKQVELARFLGISEPSVSKMVKGHTNPSEENLYKILSNPNNWDTSMLTSQENVVGDHIEQNGGKGNIGKIAGDSSGEVLALRKEIEMLRQQVEDLKEQNGKYWGMIEKLMEK